MALRLQIERFSGFFSASRRHRAGCAACAAAAQPRPTAHPHTVHGHWGAVGTADDLVPLGVRLPFLPALPVAEVLVDPRQQAAGERIADVLAREAPRADGFADGAIDVEDRRGRILE